MSVRFRVIAVFIILLALGTISKQALAQQSFASPAKAAGVRLLETSEGKVYLWGVAEINAPVKSLALRAQTLLNDMIAGKAVRCTIYKQTRNESFAQCLNYAGKDLAMALLDQGLAVVDRDILKTETVIGPVYLKAEQTARSGRRGAWGGLADGVEEKETTFLDLVLKVVWSLGPFLGLILLAMVTNKGFARLALVREEEVKRQKIYEKKLRGREQYVLAAAVESELVANKTKIKAFISIYEETLRSLRDVSKTPKYQSGGDFIHEHPALNRSVYDSNTSRLELLGPQIAKNLARLYAQIYDNPNYVTLDPQEKREAVIQQLQRVVMDANEMVKPIEEVVSGLRVVLRDKKSVALTV